MHRALRSGIEWAVKNPAIVFSVISLLAGLMTASMGYPQIAAVLIVVTAPFYVLHSQMVTRTEAHENLIKAATDVATTTAANLTTHTVGKLGQVTDEATKVATDAVGLVTELLGVK